MAAPVDALRITGLGSAIGVAAAAAAELESEGLVAIKRVQTAYPLRDSGRACAQIVIDVSRISS